MTPREYARIMHDAIRNAIRSVTKKGLTGIALAIATVTAIAAAVGYVETQYLHLVTAPPEAAVQSPPQTPLEPLVVMIDTTDKEWWKEYCREELAKLPPAPFAYDRVVDPRFTRPSTYILELIPEEKRYTKTYTCIVSYEYDDTETAYHSLGVEYKFDIKYGNAFSEKVDELFTRGMSSDWQKISPFDRKKTGIPAYSYDGLPVVFRRENPRADTVEYAEAYTASKNLYVTFAFYEKT